jgi:adenine-specific DNA-methyltransferase
MRYLGNKENLLNFIDTVLSMHGVTSTRTRPLCLCDPFTGTTSVARHLKRQEWQVVTGDLMAYSYAFQHAYIGVNDAPAFAALLDAGVLDPKINLTVPLYRVLAHLNNLQGVKDFFYWNYSPDGDAGRRYFTAANALRIDAVRQAINWWSEMGWLTEAERNVLIAALIEAVSRVANVAGTYAAYLKRWDPRAHKPLMLSAPQLVHSVHDHSINIADAADLVPSRSCDLLYVDPPYNTRQYSTSYHILETLALGDEPEIKGVAGLRAVAGQRSPYCRTGQAEQALDTLVKEAKARWLLMSYSSEGLIPHDRVVDILSQRGTVEIYACEYRRFRSDSDGDNRRYKSNGPIHEMLYWVGE